MAYTFHDVNSVQETFKPSQANTTLRLSAQTAGLLRGCMQLASQHCASGAASQKRAEVSSGGAGEGCERACLAAHNSSGRRGTCRRRKTDSRSQAWLCAWTQLYRHTVKCETMQHESQSRQASKALHPSASQRVPPNEQQEAGPPSRTLSPAWCIP